MRIGVGIILLIDLFIRSLSIIAFFTDEGVLPLETLKQYNWSPVYFSFHALNGELWWQVILFILNAICVMMLIIGYRTRLFTFICWALLTSLHNRNPFILQSGDDLLRVLLFWGLFLPWGERYSVKKSSSYPTLYFSPATIGYLLLVCSVFFFSAMLKTSVEWRTDGTALYYALSLDQIRLPLGTFLYQFPQLLKGLTYLVFYIELLAPILLLLPFVSTKVRLVGLIAYAFLYLAIGSTLYVGLFYAIGLVSLIGLLPSGVMDRFENRFYKNRTMVETLPEENAPFSILWIIVKHVKNYFLIGVAIFCLMMNLSSIKKFPYTLEPSVIAIGKALRLEQNWGMFSPTILKDDGWFVYSALSQGHYIDIKHDLDSVSFEKPAHIVTEFESDRWRKFQENYSFHNNNYMRPFYCQYLLKKWNKEHPDKPVVDLTIFFMKETSLPDYKVKPLVKTAVCNCVAE